MRPGGPDAAAAGRAVRPTSCLVPTRVQLPPAGQRRSRVAARPRVESPRRSGGGRGMARRRRHLGLPVASLDAARQHGVLWCGRGARARDRTRAPVAGRSPSAVAPAARDRARPDPSSRGRRHAPVGPRDLPPDLARVARPAPRPTAGRHRAAPGSSSLPRRSRGRGDPAAPAGRSRDRSCGRPAPGIARRAPAAHRDLTRRPSRRGIVGAARYNGPMASHRDETHVKCRMALKKRHDRSVIGSRGTCPDRRRTQRW